MELNPNISSFHPTSNSNLERCHCWMENALRSVVDKFSDSWTEAVPWVLYAYREVPIETLVFSPYELLFGRCPRSPLTLIKKAWTSLGVLKSNKKDVIDYMLILR